MGSIKTNEQQSKPKIQIKILKFFLLTMALKLNFKTLDQRNFSLTLDPNCKTVEDLICQIEDTFGRENLYKLIFAGKLLKEEHQLSDYKLNSKIPIIVMITKSPQEHLPAGQETSVVTEKNEVESANFKRVRTITEDSGIEEDISDDHFVTDAEFDSVVDIIRSCKYLSNSESDVQLTKDQTISAINKYCSETDPEEDFKVVLDGKIQKIINCNFNKAQLMALLEDIQDIYDEPRLKHEKAVKPEEIADISDFEEEDEEEEIRGKLERLTDMGFTRESAEAALTSAKNNVTVAVELLMPSTASSAPPTLGASKSNPLAFLRDIEEFQFLRYQVLHDPNLLQPLLISFGQSHPQIMKTINENKDIFIGMLYEQTGAKLHGRH